MHRIKYLFVVILLCLFASPSNALSEYRIGEKVVKDSIGNLHMVYAGEGGIYYGRSKDGGKTWIGLVNLSDKPNSPKSPSIVVSKGTVHVVWSDEVYGVRKIFYKKWTPRSGWDTIATNISNTNMASTYPSIAVDSSGDVHVVWNKEEKDGWSVLYKRCSRGIWDPESINLSGGGSLALYPQIMGEGEGLRATWLVYSPNRIRIFYKKYFASTGWEPELVDATGSAKGTLISYTLDHDAKINILVYDLKGNLVWQRVCEAGMDGGKLGYNEVRWDKSIDKGVYIYRVLKKNRAIKEGRLAVLD